MKWILIKMIKLYKKIPFKSHYDCKYYPTCSDYAIIALSRFGFFKGCYLSIKRILKCNPFSKGGIDLVPDRR